MKALQLEEDIVFSPHTEVLGNPVHLGRHTAPNRLIVHPMEGFDAQEDGSPGELSFRRYRRYGAGGAGLIWFEATAVIPEARTNPHQFYLHSGNVAAFGRLVEETLAINRRLYGTGREPVCILQLTHSGRYSKPEGRPAPVLVQHNPYLDGVMNIPANYPLLSDDELEQLEDVFVRAAQLAYRAGFHGVDIKHCHRYLGSDLLASYQREGRYGGSLANRTRFLRNIVSKIRDRLGKDFLVTTRLNVYDGLPYPYGWGTPTVRKIAEGQGDNATPDPDRFEEGISQPEGPARSTPPPEDLTEPLAVLRQLQDLGVRLVSITAGNPYYNPHINRPFDVPVPGAPRPPEHPLQGVARLFRLTARLQKALPEMVLIGAGYSWLRHYMGQAAAANIASGRVKMVGLGRGAFAYPDFARDLLENGTLQAGKTCITCSRCTQLMREGRNTGCVVFDREVYGNT